jgi:hypothetical protein
LWVYGFGFGFNDFVGRVRGLYLGLWVEFVWLGSGFCGLVVFMVYETCFMSLGLRVDICLQDYGFIDWVFEFTFIDL